MARRNHDFQTIRSEGGLLPPDLLRRVVDPAQTLPGTWPEDYGLPHGERLNEAITQSWNRLTKHWAEFRAAAENLPRDEPGTGLTNDKWSVPLLRELSFGMLPATTAPEIGGKTYAINRFFGAAAIHLVGCGLSLDRRAAGVRGAALANPHGLVQEFLNRSDTHLWAILSNGRQLRILRDSQAISRQSYLEFDLEAMFDGEVFSDFVLLWLTAHATRFEARENHRPESCWLEQWTKLAEEQGTRALGDLKGGVERALVILGQGFVGHPKNTVLRDALRTGSLTLADFHGQLLRVVYRLIFLFVAEDRTLEGVPVLHVPDDSGVARTRHELYAANYSAGRLRDLAGHIRGSRHGDLWNQFNLVVGALSGHERYQAVRESLALPALGSFLWSPESSEELNASSLTASGGTELANSDLLDAIRNLAFTRSDGRHLRPVDYRNLGAEELGGVYESLLALTPQISGDGARFTFAEFAGNERKTSGSYYTPDSLVQCLLDSALEPVIEEAIKGKSGPEAERALLELKVCDPAVGSGHFLVGAAHRLARHLARIRAIAQGEGEPSPGFYQHALRDVVGRCLYGVDINPMAAELCRVSLWLEALDPGKPLSFLDHHIRVGNSLLGTTPELIAGGLPDDAFKPIEGDDKKVCTQIRKRNKAERDGFEQRDWVGGGAELGVSADLSAVTRAASALDATTDDTVESVQRKAEQFRRLVVSPEYTHAQQVADAWCAAFVWPKTPETVNDVLTTGVIQRLAKDPKALSAAQTKGVEQLSSQYQFFHWHLAFPGVFAKGGFDCVLGNPPWDTMSPDQREFFGKWKQGLRSLSPTAQQAEIDKLLQSPNIAEQWQLHCYKLFSVVRFLKQSGVYQLFAPGNLGKGDFNLYRMFVELALRRIRKSGYVTMIVPGGFYAGANASAIRRYMLDECTLKIVLGLSNSSRLWFPEVDISRFAVFSVRCSGSTDTFQVAFGINGPEELGRPTLRVSADVIREQDPETYTIAEVQDLRAGETSIAMRRRFPAFGDVHAAPPVRHYLRELDMGNDRRLFNQDMGGLPLYEGRMVGQFDYRFKSYVSGHGNSSVWIEQPMDSPAKAIVPQWRVRREELPSRLGNRIDRFRIGFRDVAQPRDERSLIACLIPPNTVCGDKVPTIDFPADYEWAYMPWLAVANSFSMDWLVRSRLSSPKMSFTLVDSLPFPRFAMTDEWIQVWAPLVLRLTCTGPEMTPYWNAMADLGLVQEVPEDTVPRDALLRDSDRAAARATLDASVALHVFGLSSQELGHIMDTFPIVKRKDEARYGSYRTKEAILAIYDEMQEAIRTGIEYRTRLEPPPGDRRCCHEPRNEKKH